MLLSRVDMFFPKDTISFIVNNVLIKPNLTHSRIRAWGVTFM